MSTSQPGFFVRFLRGIWNTLNFTRRLILNTILVIVLALLFSAFFRSTPILDEQTALVLDPEGTVVEQYSADASERALAGLTGNTVREIQLRDILQVIDAAGRDPNIARIVLVPDQMAAGISTMREIGQALDRFRATAKDVVVVSEGMQQGQYYLAAHADQILLDPQGSVLLEGFANYRSYYRDALDKLGVEVHLIRVGEYKSAGEPYILDHASDAAKEADLYWMGGIWNEFLDEIAAMRKLDSAAIADDIAQLDVLVPTFNGDLAKLALDHGLVDKLATRPQARKLLSDLGKPDDSGETFRQVNWSNYLGMQVASRLPDARPEVAVVVAQGEIVQGEQAKGDVGATTTARLLRQVRDDERVKAVVLRVDSPGGDAYASEIIRREVKLIQEAGKPVVVSMGDVAASGGYWISMDADEIWAQPTTITGSIGIYGMLVTIPQTLEKLGIYTDGVATTPIAGAFDIRRPLDPKVETILTSVIQKGYRDFIGKVASARGKTPAEINAIAQGRVWSGSQARQRGLVDKLGGLHDAISAAAAIGKLGNDFQTRYVERKMSTWERFALSLSNSDAAVSFGRWSGLTSLPTRLLASSELQRVLGMLNHLGGNRFGVVAHCNCGLNE
ncbi:MAG TPA: signal peptide peptidase SppA [Dokdonella sp.]|uniref:signal peptide peptidase SppA n=1 Tax=Dokdonella sp. TaxID=2291710 RepID=UPI002D811538|nr:signal peptide peptidase SppA [Dokdonella sp.]HET9031647.1 signal peptide peptidase SppA [Dokdonella sp.]